MPRLATLAKHFAVAAVIGAATPALAAGDNGIRIGESGRLHLIMEVDAGYDSNILLSARRLDGPVLDFMPGFTLSAPGRMVTVDFNGGLDYKLYTTSDTNGLSRLFGNASLGLGFNRDGEVGLELSDSFTHSGGTRSYAIAQSVVANYNDLKVKVPFSPGGRALTLTVGGDWLLETFESYVDYLTCNPALNPTCTTNIGQYGYNQYGGSLEAKWKFLPRTALLLEGSYFKRDPKDTSLALAVQGLKFEAGLAGLVTTHLAVTLKAGWGTSLNSGLVPYSTWLANAELEFVSQSPIGLRLGYLHTLQADTGKEFAVYGTHRAYLDGKVLLGGRLTIHGMLSYDYLDYVGANVTSHILTFSPGLDYEVIRWVTVGAGYSITYRSSGLHGAIPAFDYTRNQAFARVVFTY
jgi:hypothetical protein